MKRVYTTFLLAFGLLSLIRGQAPAPLFLNEIDIPPLVTNPDNYQLNVIETTHDFNPHNPNDPLNGVTTFAYEDANNMGTTSILGPTLLWGYQNMLSPTVSNMLSERTTCHWHGAHVPQYADGGPYQIIEPSAVWNPSFQVLDKSATMWYHPHAMGLTYKHVQMGLSGIIIVEDPNVDPVSSNIHSFLPTSYNVDDFPLIFQTKKFDEDANGQMQIRSGFPGFKDDYEFMVNGIIDPYIKVPANMVRLRLLNGDGKFSFNFTFEDSDGNPFPAQMIATDAGYMNQSYQIDELLMAPGERTEWLIDARGLEGDTLYIKNKVSTMPAGTIGNSSTTNNYAADRNLLQIVIGAPTGGSSPIIGFPIPLQPSEAPPISDVTRTRKKVFRKGVFQDNNGNDLFSIDSMLMDMTVVNDTVMLDATELWTLENTTNVGHPWHIHDIHFWVTEVIDANNTPLDPNAYPEIFSGPKDNIMVQPGWTVSYITTFSDYSTPVLATNSYMYHCHILPHEDKGMMGTFVVWDGVSVNVPEVPNAAAIDMTIFPNPAQDLFHLEGESTAPSTLRLLNVQGQVLEARLLPSFKGTLPIHIDHLPAGVLLVEWETQAGKAMQKLVISR